MGVFSVNKLKKFSVFIIIIITLAFFIFFRENFEKVFSVNIKGYDSKKTIVILVDLEANTLGVFQNDKLLKTYTVAGGKPSTPSPIGTWTIISKDTWGEGFGGRWMGFNVPWGKYGIHGTDKPGSIGWSSSHGCIRMRNNDVKELYKITPHGTKVIINGGPYGNFGSYLRPLEPGMRGSDVYEVQKYLKEKGYYNGNPDGIYGEGMKAIVHKFQKDHKLPISNIINSTFYKKLGIELKE